ncbi:MAG: cell division protein FtsQ/DivIB [Gammaproteobacteria bacterium]|nr:cell division protein FtsQ/DivIB [Gammaproteobacteria bacterium]
MRQVSEDAPEAARLPVLLLGLGARVLLAAAAWGIRWLVAPATLPIREIKVSGQFRQLRPDAIRTLVQEAIDGGFFAVDVAAIRQRLLREPWVKQAAIQRIWPTGLQVTIVEQDALARWGDEALLNGEGVVFRPLRLEVVNLPRVRLAGPSGAEGEVLAMYRTLSRLLVESGVTIAELSLSERGSWTAATGEGTSIVLGRTAVERRAQRLLAALRGDLAADWPNVAAIDLRYANGFAVRRRTNIQ